MRLSLTGFNSTFGNSVKSCISEEAFLKEGLVQVALGKAAVIDPFVELFKAVLYERSWSLPPLM